MVFHGATPEFRRLLYYYLAAGQCGSDVTRLLTIGMFYDPKAKALTFAQVKARNRMALPVGETLHGLLVREDGQSALLTPRGRA